MLRSFLLFFILAVFNYSLFASNSDLFEDNSLSSYQHILTSYKSVLDDIKKVAATEKKDNDTIVKEFFFKARAYHKRAYAPYVECLRNKSGCTRSDILNLFENDILLESVVTRSGHVKFKCALLNITFGLVNHGTIDITSDAEYAGLHATIQPYLNVIKFFVRDHADKLIDTLKQMKAQDWQEALEQEKERYDSYIHDLDHA